MTLESYGGNASIVASVDEIQRIAGQLQLAARALTELPTLATFLTDSISSLRFSFSSNEIVQKLDRLIAHCQLAAAGYFTTEAQIHSRFQVHFIPELASIAIWAGSKLGWQYQPPISATESASYESEAPDSVRKLLTRVEGLSVKSEPTIGIDIYEGEGTNRLAIVYIPGTQELQGGRNPLDLQSNLEAMASPLTSSTERATLEAIEQAGIVPSDEVLFVGHSQGGLVGGNLLEEANGFVPLGLVSFGAPLAQLALRRGSVIAIEHTKDPVPNLSGRVNPLRANWLTVQRTLPAGELKQPFASHSLNAYEKTAKEIDASNRTDIASMREKLIARLRNRRRGVSKDYVIRRITESSQF